MVLDPRVEMPVKMGMRAEPHPNSLGASPSLASRPHCALGACASSPLQLQIRDDCWHHRRVRNATALTATTVTATSLAAATLAPTADVAPSVHLRVGRLPE